MGAGEPDDELPPPPKLTARDVAQLRTGLAQVPFMLLTVAWLTISGWMSKMKRKMITRKRHDVLRRSNRCELCIARFLLPLLKVQFSADEPR